MAAFTVSHCEVSQRRCRACKMTSRFSFKLTVYSCIKPKLVSRLFREVFLGANRRPLCRHLFCIVVFYPHWGRSSISFRSQLFAYCRRYNVANKQDSAFNKVLTRILLLPTTSLAVSAINSFGVRYFICAEFSSESRIKVVRCS